MSKLYAVSLAILAALVLVQLSDARPSATLSRPKRVSDQRLAELETLISLAKMRGKLVTVPIGFGKVDPKQIGRKRRSSTENNLQELRRILRSLLEEDSELGTRYARLVSSRWEEKEPEERSDDPSEDEADLGLY